MAPSLTLVGRTGFRTFRNVWMFEELQVAYDHVLAFPRSKLARQHHPLGKIPALVIKEGGAEHVLFESAAMNTYLGDALRGAGAGHALVPPAGTLARGQYDQWVGFLMSEVDAQGLWIHRKHEALGEVFGAIPAAVTAARENFARALQVVAAAVAGRGPYLLGAEFTAADILLVHCLDWAETIGWDDVWENAPPGDALRHLPQYTAACRARAAYRAAKAKQKAEDRLLQEKRRQKRAAKQSGKL